VKAKHWKYGLLKVGPKDDDNVLVEFLYGPDAEGVKNYEWSEPMINTLEELEAAVRDVQHEGIVTWWFEHGSFYSGGGSFWGWEKHDEEAEEISRSRPTE